MMGFLKDIAKVFQVKSTEPKINTEKKHRWTDSEKAMLMELADQNKKAKEIAEIMGMREGQIRKMLGRLCEEDMGHAKKKTEKPQVQTQAEFIFPKDYDKILCEIALIKSKIANLQTLQMAVDNLRNKNMEQQAQMCELQMWEKKIWNKLKDAGIIKTKKEE